MSERQSGGEINEQWIDDDPSCTRAHRAERVDRLIGDHGRICARRADIAELKWREALAGEVCPLVIGFDAGHPQRIELPIVSDLTAGQRAARLKAAWGN